MHDLNSDLHDNVLQFLVECKMGVRSYEHDEAMISITKLDW